MSTTRSYIKSSPTTPVTTLPIPPTVTQENAAILNIHMPSDIDNAYYPFPLTTLSITLSTTTMNRTSS